jgi:hypothetical protein
MMRKKGEFSKSLVPRNRKTPFQEESLTLGERERKSQLRKRKMINTMKRALRKSIDER